MNRNKPTKPPWWRLQIQETTSPPLLLLPPSLLQLQRLLWTEARRGEQPTTRATGSKAKEDLRFSFYLQRAGMVEKSRAMTRKLDIPAPAGTRSPWKSDGLPSPTSPLDRAAAPSPRGWRHRDAGGVGLGILAALEAQPSSAAASCAPIARRAARLEVSELGCSGRCATSLCGGGNGRSAGAGAAFRVAEFLSCCDTCQRALDGKDIFMYRGERAFCSMECRYHAIVSDECREDKERKRAAVAALKKTDAEMGSPCNGGGQIFFTTGIVAA